MLQSAKLAASEFGFNRTATVNDGEETNAAENDDDAGDDDDDEDERLERNADYDADEEEKADLSDGVESGSCQPAFLYMIDMILLSSFKCQMSLTY